MSDCKRGYCSCLDTACDGTASLSDLQRAVDCPNTDVQVAQQLSKLIDRLRVARGER